MIEEVAYISSHSLFFRGGDDNRDHVEIMVRGKMYVALLDSGAQINVIRANWFTNITDWGDALEHPNSVTTWDHSAHYKPTGVVNVA